MPQPEPNQNEAALRRAADWCSLAEWLVMPSVDPVVLAGVIAAVERLEREEGQQ